MSEILRWWLVLLVVGVALLPLCLALFRRLPDRGYALSKPFGVVVLGYTFWLLNSIRLIPNSAVGIWLVLVLLAALAAWFAYREWDGLVAWVRGHWPYIAGVEVLFLLVFGLAVWLRSLVGNIAGTEQPMDLMFLNSVTRAENFPPEDPWLSGHTVAYYYFGYLLVGMVGKLAAVPTEIGYNVGLGMIAAMTLVGAAGLVYNLVAMREEAEEGEAEATPERVTTPKPKKVRQSRRAVVAAGERGSVTVPGGAPLMFSWRPVVFGLAGGLILVVMGNLVFVLTFASAYGIGGQGFYDWVNVNGLNADELRHAWYPAEFFEFFSVSRIFPIDSPEGKDDTFRVITEFPMFSFLLGDLHPHVMALPFVLLVVGLGLTLYRSPEPLDITFWLERPLTLVASAVLLGALGFINTWDVATFAFVLTAAAFVANYMRVRAITGDLFVQVISFAAPLIVLAFLLYVPFFVSISGNSQVEGISAVVSNASIIEPATRPLHALLFWGPLFVLTVPFVVARLLARRDAITLQAAAWSAAPATLVIVGWAAFYLLQLGGLMDEPLGAQPGSLFEQIGDRGWAWVTALFLGAVLSAALLAIWVELRGDGDVRERAPVLFALMLIATSMLLILGCEFFFIDDVFSARMNTVFKLYYQAWLMLALAGGFALYYLASRWPRAFPYERGYRYAWGALAAITLVAAALYPLGGTYNRTRPYNAEGTLVETGGELAGLSHFNPDDQAGIDYLTKTVSKQDGVIAEAVTGDYQAGGRISAATGIPAIIGWQGHEDQWRSGTCKPCIGRYPDVEMLYRSVDMAAAAEILRKYGVTYVYVGPLERTLYGSSGGLTKFDALPDGAVAFRQGEVTIIRASSLTGEVSPE